MFQVVLVVPPFFMGGKPSLTNSLLKSALTGAGITSTIIYANLIFKQMVDHKEYEEFSVMAYHNDIIEYVFASEAFPGLHERHGRYAKKLKLYDPAGYKKLHSMHMCAKSLISKTLELITKHQPRIVWLYSFVKQTTSSIAIADALKKNCPGITVCSGGHSCQRPIAEELVKIAPAIDYIFNGEPEEAFKTFCIDYFADPGPHDQKYPDKIIDCTPVTDMDKLPYPDFHDYFEQSCKLWQFSRHIGFEASRGCFMGEESVCIFCGHHNKQGVRYRKKSPQRALNELHCLTTIYKPERIYAKDSALPMDYPEKVLAYYNKPKHVKDIFFEVSPRHSYQQLKIMKNKGINTLQPGIESFSDRLLSILQKKTTVYNNIRFLRDCRSLDIKPLWNFLYRIPGESETDYTGMANFIPALFHLQPPYTIRPLFIMRYSPLFEHPHSYKLSNIKPVDSFYYLFPEETNSNNLSLFFTADYDTVHEHENSFSETRELMNEWQNIWRHGKYYPVLELHTNNLNYHIKDTRPIAQHHYTHIDNSHKELLQYLNTQVPEKKLHALIEQKKLFKQLEVLINNQWVLKLDTHYISLVTQTI